MAGVWRGVLCTHAVMVARRTFHGGGSVGALAVDGRRSRGRGPVWCAPRGTRRATRSTHVRGARAVGARTGVRTGGTRRPPAVRPMLMLHCPWACAPLPIFYRPITENKPQTAPLVCSMDLPATNCHFPVPPARSNSRPFAVHRAVRAPWWERALCSRLTCARANLLLQPRTARPKTSTVPCASPCSEACDWLARPPIASPPLSAASGAHRSAHTPTVH